MLTLSNTLMALWTLQAAHLSLRDGLNAEDVSYQNKQLYYHHFDYYCINIVGFRIKIYITSEAYEIDFAILKQDFLNDLISTARLAKK